MLLLQLLLVLVGDTSAVCPSVNSITPVYGAGVKNQSSVAKDNEVGSIYNFFCSKYLDLVPASPRWRECLANGSWSGPDHVCIPKPDARCSPLTLPEHAKVDNLQPEYKLYTILKLSCERGWIGEGNSTLQCNYQGKWALNFSCLPACLAEDLPDHTTTAASGSYRVGESLSLTCREGYYANATHATCGGDQEWHGFQCRHGCDLSSLPEGVTAEGGETSIRPNSSITGLACQPGYRESGPDEAYCDSSGEWRTDFSCCKSCPSFTPSLGSQFCAGEALSSGETKLTCLDCGDGAMVWKATQSGEEATCSQALPFQTYLYWGTIAVLLVVIASLATIIRLRIRNRTNSIASEVIAVKPASQEFVIVNNFPTDNYHHLSSREGSF